MAASQRRVHRPFPILAVHPRITRVLHIVSGGSYPRGREAAGGNMTGYKAAISGAALVFAGVVTGSSAALAQSFENYRCADGTRFIVGFFKYDTRAHLQIDGRAVTLKKRLAFSGAHYSGGGVTLMITKAGSTIRHVKRPVTACELT
ncbi:MliC family protein [Bradyrhizobium sp.]|uniref:MliC family protein n=1 Tax=Bradyrhizobium sp. TaxID=376 RepID=UPI00344900C5